MNISDDIIEILNALGLAENENPERQKKIEELAKQIGEKGKEMEEKKMNEYMMKAWGISV